MMDRRRFFVGVGLCGALALPFGCGPEKEDKQAAPEDEADPKEGETEDATGETSEPTEGEAKTDK